MFNATDLAILIVETQKDKHVIPGVLDNIKSSLFGQTPTFIVVSGEGAGQDLTAALNNGIDAAIGAGCKYLFWAHPDMRFIQPNWCMPLIEMLDTKPRVLKACASNSRDPIGPLRLDQEQSWMMRVSDFEKFENLRFNPEFKRIGGFEDWYQSWSIITSGYLVLVTPQSQVYHEGMGTRKLRDTVQEQQDNGAVYHRLTGQHENPHQWKFFMQELELGGTAYVQAWEEVLAQFPEFTEIMQQQVPVAYS